MCEHGLQSQCETTQVREQGMGAALFGYTKLYGEVPGGQAELLRAPRYMSSRRSSVLPGGIGTAGSEPRSTSRRSGRVDREIGFAAADFRAAPALTWRAPLRSRQALARLRAAARPCP